MEPLKWNLQEEELETKLLKTCKQLSQSMVNEVQQKYEKALQQLEQERINAMKQLELERQKMNEEFKAKEMNLQKQSEELALERKKWNDDQEAMKKLYGIQDSQIKLDIGGYHFTTSISTLTKEPDSMLSSMFSGRFPIHKNEEGRVFIDRDGSMFSFILEYLRDGEFDVPEDPKIRKKLVREVEYFGIHGMRAVLDGENCNDNALLPTQVLNQKTIPKTVYIIGGSRDGYKSTKITLRYDFGTAEWDRPASVLTGRAYFGIAPFHSKIFVAVDYVQMMMKVQRANG